MARCKQLNALRTAHTTAEALSNWSDLKDGPVAAATAHNRSWLKSGWWDLNPRPPGPEPGALPS